MMSKSRLEELYTTQLRSQLKEALSLKNVMEVPRLSKIVLNVGVKDADGKGLQFVMDMLGKITGQQPVKRLARKSIASFKLRQGMPIGVKVTLRRKKMYEFLDKLINLALPKVKDFQGVNKKFDGKGNYNLGIKEWIIFPEVSYDAGDKIHGLNITIGTTAVTDEQGFALLKSFGMPFKKM
jgi:large subunit ribosomal protein L5